MSKKISTGEEQVIYFQERKMQSWGRRALVLVTEGFELTASRSFLFNDLEQGRKLARAIAKVKLHKIKVLFVVFELSFLNLQIDIEGPSFKLIRLIALRLIRIYYKKSLPETC